ncbi:sigma-70 family RNA polymerase sigma factor [Streptomyces sp. NPDC051940]|uniref:RNA polymerase sigma factor n=1 Tax=Streptomyces sp. NPDC051940 TaxID=3155675 RepID=UPI00341C9932
MSVEPAVRGEPLPDQELRRRLVYGDESALREVYDTHGPLVRRVALRVTRSPAGAEEVAQEVFTQLWERPFAFDPDRGALRTWLSVLAHRRAVDWVRGEEKQRRAVERTDPATDPGPGPAEAAMAAEQRLALHSALALLPPAQREAVHLAYFAGHSYRQTARELGIPEGTAKTRLRAALRALAERLGDGGGDARPWKEARDDRRP